MSKISELTSRVKIYNMANIYIKSVQPQMSLLLFSPSVVSNSFESMDYSTPDFPVLHYLLELLKFISTESVMPSNHLILCHPLILPPLIFSSIRVFSNGSALHIRWPKYRRFSLSLSPSNEYSGLEIPNNSNNEQSLHDY